jgi:protein TonB
MERRLFEDLIESDVVSHKTRQSLTFPISVAAHAIAIAAVVIVPLLTSEELPDPTAVVRAFFVEPAAPPPPPPPPPPPRQAPTAPQVQPKPMLEQTPTFTAPLEVPDEIAPEDGLDLGLEGVLGGVEGGIMGGVVGGVVGGLPDPTAGLQAVRVGGQIKEPRKLRNVNPIYPDIAKQARVQGVVILECTISPQGKVRNVKVLRGIPLLDQAAIEAVQQWVYTPTLLNGVPVPVIMTVTVNFRLS